MLSQVSHALRRGCFVMDTPPVRPGSYHPPGDIRLTTGGGRQTVLGLQTQCILPIFKDAGDILDAIVGSIPGEDVGCRRGVTIGADSPCFSNPHTPRTLLLPPSR